MSAPPTTKGKAIVYSLSMVGTQADPGGQTKCPLPAAGGGFLEGDCQVAALQLLVDFDYLVEANFLVPHVDRSRRSLGALAELRFIERGHAVAGANFARINRAGAEVLVGYVEVLVSSADGSYDQLRLLLAIVNNVAGTSFSYALCKGIYCNFTI